MRAARPVIETGMLTGSPDSLRCVHVGGDKSTFINCKSHALQLVDIFGTTRDDWMAEDLQAWLQSNGIYDKVPQILQHLMNKEEVYIVTTKQARFTEALMKDMAKIPIQADRIFSQAESGRPKTEVLRMLAERHPGTEYHFIEDKFGTLEKVIAEGDLQNWQLYLVDWGYNTAAERKAAKDTGRVQVVDKAGLQRVAGLQ